MKKELQKFFARFPSNNITTFQAENGKENQNCQAELVTQITNAVFFYNQSKTRYIADLYTKAKEFADSPYAGTDTHEQALTGQLEYITCQEVAEQESSDLLQVMKEIYKETTGQVWSVPETKLQRELRQKATKETASAVELSERLAKRFA